MNELINKASPYAKFTLWAVTSAVAMAGFLYTILIKDAQQDGLIRVNRDNIQANKIAFDARLDKFEARYEQDSAKTYARMDKDKQELMNYIDKMETRLIYRLDRTDKKIDQLSELMKGK